MGGSFACAAGICSATRATFTRFDPTCASSYPEGRHLFFYLRISAKFAANRVFAAKRDQDFKILMAAWAVKLINRHGLNGTFDNFFYGLFKLFFVDRLEKVGSWLRLLCLF